MLTSHICEYFRKHGFNSKTPFKNLQTRGSIPKGISPVDKDDRAERGVL